MIDKMTAKLKHLPVDPGVYQFFNSKNEIIYIGKAKIFEIGLDHTLEVKRNVSKKYYHD